MKRERYTALPNDVSVFRTARVGGGFLPPGHLLPKPEWLEPTKVDQEEAKKRGRPPGTSVWEAPGATHATACWIRRADERDQRSFIARVDGLHAIAAKHSRELKVVADALAHPHEDDERWASLPNERKAQVRAACDAHSLVEGIKRPKDIADLAHRSFREELARQFAPITT